MATNPTDLVRLADASQQTGVPVRTLREWIRTGKLTKYKQGGATGFYVFVSLAEIEARQRVERVDGE